ncbi:PREDICTED: uncharacterized protein LOC109166665 [Ipomoea nil]|uniref:uncharacterized protein LOC109166665 n=1 Tax=Ipomoea nil TaxID=35883 RepID=UPI000900E20C|nr:PREDICTED: uncharacterized protein LOC109166665 [Ipomoea nil]
MWLLDLNVGRVSGSPPSLSLHVRRVCSTGSSNRIGWSILVVRSSLPRSNGRRWGPRKSEAAETTDVGQGKKSKVSRCVLGGAPSCVSDDDFVSPQLAFFARLEQDPLWNVLDDDSMSEEECARS